MAADREPDTDRPAGLDVWLPAAVAVAAALFLLASAHAEPRPIYDPARFAEGALEREAAALAIARGAYAVAAPAVQAEVEVVALPPPETAMVVRDPEAAAPRHTAHAAPATRPEAGWLKLLVPGAIAAMLAGALAALGRVWRHTGPQAPA